MSATATFRTWSCTVRLVVEDERALEPARQELTALLDRVDRVASRFRADSALSIANARAGRPSPVPHLLVDLVGAALRAAERTDGAVVPTVGDAMVALGYRRDIAAVTDDGESGACATGAGLARGSPGPRGRAAHRAAAGRT